jgi:hypothetical protein
MDAARAKYIRESKLRIDKAIAMEQANKAQRELNKLASQGQNVYGAVPIGMIPVLVNGCIVLVPVQSGYRPMQMP